MLKKNILIRHDPFTIYSNKLRFEHNNSNFAENFKCSSNYPIKTEKIGEKGNIFPSFQRLLEYNPVTAKLFERKISLMSI